MKWGEKAVKIKCKQQEMRKDKLRITGEWVQLYFFILFTNKVVSMAEPHLQNTLHNFVEFLTCLEH